MVNLHIRTAVTISVLQTASMFCNKYVLTELGFKYPMVFQGWQTLVGFLVLRIWTSSFLPLSLRLKKAITPMDKPGFVSLFPFFLFFTASLITGSKALSTLSITEFAVASNFIPAGIFLISERKNFCIQQAASIIVSSTSLVFGVYGFFFQSNSEEGFYSPYFWLLVHILCVLASSLHSRICDARYMAIDRLYYGYVFSFIVLAPASIYLEEAFEALNFQHRRQMSFLLGSLASGISGAALNAFLCNGLKSISPSGLVVHSGTLVSVVGSWMVFANGPLPLWAWILILVNLTLHLLVPTYFNTKDVEESGHEEDELDKEVLLA
uniref:Transmembrane protein C18orf45 n=1 Tax=Caligus clemensi TaxID=344056 RepID=C1C0X5_CALCM|nr:Transmembrane protein C18orf45 [Caligus clemensi]